MTYRVRNIIIAAVLALTAAMLALFYVANYKRHVQHSESTVAVLVAKGDIPVGTSGADILKHHMLTSSQVVQRTIVPGAISNADQVQNLVTTAPIYSGEQVTLRRFANHVELGPRAQLHGTLRAISLEGDSAQLLAGTIKQGDHVDMLATWRYCGTDTCIVSRDVARNLLVLQAPDGPTSKLATSQTTSILLATSDRHDAQKVWWAAKNSIGWTLALRPVSNATDSPEDAESTGSMTVDGLNQANTNHFNQAGAK
jgi:Flp pilus assembly protein CpaB